MNTLDTNGTQAIETTPASRCSARALARFKKFIASYAPIVPEFAAIKAELDARAAQQAPLPERASLTSPATTLESQPWPEGAKGPHSNPDGTLKNLNKVGNQGWEAVAWLPHSGDKDSGWVLLKKPVRK